MLVCGCAHTLFTVTQDAYLLHAHILHVFPLVSPSQSVPPLFFRQTHTSMHTHTHTPLWSDWCCKLAWVCRWSGCDYCLALRQLWWWHSVLWAPLAWARSKHNQAVHSLPRNHAYMWPRYYCNTHSPHCTKCSAAHSGSGAGVWSSELTKKHISAVLCAPWGQMMCILLSWKVRYGFRGHITICLTPWLCDQNCLQEVQPALESAAPPQFSSIFLCCRHLCLYSICSKCLFASFICQA